MRASAVPEALKPVMARKCCRKVDGLMCARSAKSSTCMACTKFCLSHATALAICWLGDPNSDEVPQMRAMRTCQQADGDLLLDERRQPGNQ